MSESDHIPVPSDPKRQRKVGAFLIREKHLAEMEKGIKSGLHFVDAAERAQIPFEVALSRITHDEEMREWFLESKDRELLSNLPETEVLPDTINPIEMKHGFLQMLWDAGLFHKAANMARLADEGDVRGGNVIAGLLKISKDFFPRETTAKLEHKGDNEGKTEDELKARLEELGGKYKQLLKDVQKGNETRQRLAGLLDDGSGEDAGGAA